MTRELTDEQLLAMWAGNDERALRPVLGGNKIKDFARAIIKADRALRVPMTEDEIDAKWELSYARCWIEFEEGIRAAEAFHGIGAKA